MGVIQRAVDRSLAIRFPVTASQQAIDLRALEVATAAKALHDQHADECKERYVEQDRKLDAIRDAQKSDLNRIEAAIKEVAKAREESSRRLYTLLWQTAGASILLLLTIIGYLLTHGGIVIAK